MCKIDDRFFEDFHLEAIEKMVREEAGDEVLERLMDNLSEYYGRKQGMLHEMNRFKVAIRGTQAGIQNLFVENIHKKNMVFALALFRAKPQVIGAKLFVEHFESITVYIMESGCFTSLDMVWFCLPSALKTTLGEKLPDIWWAKEHKQSAVIIAQSDKVSVTDAMLFALRISSEHSAWSELIVQKQCERR